MGKCVLIKNLPSGAIEEKVAKPLGVSSTEATWGIHDLINETMAMAAKTHIAEKGGNPKIATICAFGGAGPVHAYGLAKKMEASGIIVPPMAGVGSALGFFTASRAFDVVRSHKVGVPDADFGAIERLFRDMEAEGADILGKTGGVERIKYERSIDMRFVGQGAETNVPVPAQDFSQLTGEEARKLFDEKYQSLYGRTYPESPAEFVNFKVRASLPERTLPLPKMEKKTSSLKDAIKGQRLAYSAIAAEFIPYTVYDRYILFPDAKFDGPAIIEERESTIVVGEDASVSVNEYGFLWITFKEGEQQ